MKKKILALGCMAALLAFGSEAQAADNINGTATATIQNAVSIANNTSATGGGVLAFGTIVAGTQAGSVDVSTTGTPSYHTVIGASGATTSAAAFTVTGGAGNTFTVTLPSSATLTHSTLMSKTMTVNSFVSSAAGVGGGTIGADGTVGFTVGGTLTVAANQTNGSYTGTFNVSVAYN